MRLIESIPDLRQWREGQGAVAFVPTMGNLHEGHLHLVDCAKRYADTVIVSIFVNRLQFGAGEDFDRYPRTFEADCAKLREQGVAAVFAPSEGVLYPSEQRYFIEPPPMAELWCGAARPGHFRGVTTVVGKLFNLMAPQFAIFGKKDYQQLSLIRGMVRELNFPLEIVGAETQRAPDGLALSSRNAYLSAEQRAEAPRLYQTLLYIKSEVQAGSTGYRRLEDSARESLISNGWVVDYIACCDARTLEPYRDGVSVSELVVLAAARLGATRLIDNVEICAAPLAGL